MKNLLIYVNPNGFDSESQKLVKIQIDNSLELGWEKKDIILVTNFPYEYGGIKAVIVKKGFFPPYPRATKITTIIHLFEIGFISDDLYWFHDLDAYQLEPITPGELGLSEVDAGFTDYCRVPLWNTGSFFFKKGAESIFRDIAGRLGPGLDKNGHERHEEWALEYLTDNNIHDINKRIKRLNNTYNFGMRKIDFCYEKAIKPLKVLHFHPESKLLPTLAIAMYGTNRLNMPLMTERLIEVFNRYGYS